MVSTPDDDVDVNGVGMRRLRSVLAGIDAGDFERFDPPADVWQRISASVAATRTPAMVVEYWIDADDIVFASGDGWTGFARGNDAAELVELAPDRTLWSHFDGADVRDLWRTLVGRVRSQQAAATVPLRCDAPDARRWFEMTIAPGDNQTVHFRSALVFEEPRTPVPFLATQTERDAAAPAIAVCSWCNQGHDGSSWVDIEDLVRRRRLLEQTVVPPIAHGICPSCREAMSAELLVPASRRDTSG